MLKNFSFNFKSQVNKIHQNIDTVDSSRASKTQDNLVQQQQQPEASLDTVDRHINTKKSLDEQSITAPSISNSFKQKITEIISVPKPIIETTRPDQPSHYYYPPESIDTTRPYSMTVSQFESVQKFYTQIVEWFLPFDELYDKFQADCEGSKLRLKDRKFLESVSDLDRLAIAAKFDEDGVWYRARVLSDCGEGNESHVMIEFVDYGNRQLTPVVDCVLLTEEFAKFRQAAVRCSGVAFLESEMNLKLIENLVCYFKVRAFFFLVSYQVFCHMLDSGPVNDISSVSWRNIQNTIYAIFTYFLSIVLII